MWPSFSSLEIKKVSKVIKSGRVNYWTGDECKKFEQEFANYFGVKYCIAVANASLGLEASVAALNLNPRDEVITTARSYCSSATSILRSGAKVIFADICKETQNIDPISIKKKITKKTRAILCVHLAGMPCDISSIRKIANKNNLFLIEDCSQAHGAKYLDKYVGSFGDISVWSFCNDKIMSTLGEGGMIGVKNFKIYKKLWSIKEIGKDYNLSKTGIKPEFKWIHNTLGTNMRMTEVQACVGRLQLKQLNKNVKTRRKIAKILTLNLKNSKIFKTPEIKKGYYHSYYKYYIFLNLKNIKKKWKRSNIINFIKDKGINVSVGSCPEIYKERVFQKIYKYKILKNANAIGRISIAFSLNHYLPTRYVKNICKTLKKIETLCAKKI